MIQTSVRMSGLRLIFTIRLEKMAKSTSGRISPRELAAKIKLRKILPIRFFFHRRTVNGR